MTTHTLRDYQRNALDFALDLWRSGKQAPLLVLPARSGKTVVFCQAIVEVGRPAVVIAHRTELLSQASVALAEEGVRHRVIGSDTLRRECSVQHLEKIGKDYIDPGAQVAIASVDTLRNADPKDPFIRQIGLAVVDEGHHLLRENKWGKCIEVLPPGVLILSVTATPLRADGKGLGRHADGFIDAMHVGPSPRELINRGLIAEYRIVAPPNDIDLSAVSLSAGGDFSPEKLRAAVHKASRLVGDVVGEYLKRCAGLRGMTFCVDVESATEISAAYRQRGVTAEVVTANTPSTLRAAIMRKYEAGDLHQLVNVDLFGEGVNIKCMEVVSLARPTASYGLFVQQFFRPHTKTDVKRYGWVLDHVGNVARHGLPDTPRQWSLNRRERAAKGTPSDAIPTRTCLNEISEGEICANVYERVLECCPECGHVPVPASRSGPEQVDGDLTELSPEVLAKMRGEIDRVMGPPLIPGGMPSAAQYGLAKAWNERLKVQEKLRHAIALWGGWQQHQGRDTKEAMRRFYFRFGVDTGTAATLGRTEAEALLARVQVDLDGNNIVDGSVT